MNQVVTRQVMSRSGVVGVIAAIFIGLWSALAGWYARELVARHDATPETQSAAPVK